MTSMAAPRFECAPHATRSLALALTLSLNLAIVLFALLPSTPHTLHAPPPQSLLAVLQPPPPVPPPAAPTLPVVRHVAAPVVHLAIAHPMPIATPALPTLAPVTPVAPVQTPTSASATDATAPAGNSTATLAYETATPPAYPRQALRAGIQGTVLLKVLVDPNGKPIQVMIEHSSGSRLLDDAARRHVLTTWRFHPALRGGHAIEAWAVVPVQFNLNQD